MHRLTFADAVESARVIADAHMRQAGRQCWDDSDRTLFESEFHRLFWDDAPAH